MGGMATSPLPSRGPSKRGQKMGETGENWGGNFARRTNVLSLACIHFVHQPLVHPSDLLTVANRRVTPKSQGLRQTDRERERERERGVLCPNTVSGGGGRFFQPGRSLRERCPKRQFCKRPRVALGGWRLVAIGGWGTGGATTIGPDATHPPATCQNLGHEVTDTGLAYAPVSQAHGHHHTV